MPPSGDQPSASRVFELERELEALRERLHTSVAEAERLQGKLRELGATRDSLAAELESKTEAAASLKQVARQQ